MKHFFMYSRKQNGECRKSEKKPASLPIWFPFQLVNKHKALTSTPIEFTYRENQ